MTGAAKRAQAETQVDARNGKTQPLVCEQNGGYQWLTQQIRTE
jgi:hypothetical protein